MAVLWVRGKASVRFWVRVRVMFRLRHRFRLRLQVRVMIRVHDRNSKCVLYYGKGFI